MSSVDQFEVIPAIDLLGGRCVRLFQGDYQKQTVYSEDPAEVAKRWVAEGARRIHLVDLDGAKHGRPTNVAVIERICREIDASFQLGGGLRTTEAIARAFDMGVSLAIVGSRGVTDPDWLARIADRWPGRILLGVDVRDGKVAIRGWEASSAANLPELLAYAGELPLGGVIYTTITRDGTLMGPAFEELDRAASVYSGPLYASGGIASPADIERLAEMPLAGCIVGKALYEGTVSLPDAIGRAARVRNRCRDAI